MKIPPIRVTGDAPTNDFEKNPDLCRPAGIRKSFRHHDEFQLDFDKIPGYCNDVVGLFYPTLV
jgi:hypothetical protein